MKKLGWPEPGLALCGGNTGVAVTQQLIPESFPYLLPGGFLVIESAPGLMDELTQIMKLHDFVDVSVIRDLGGRDRVIVGRKPWDK